MNTKSAKSILCAIFFGVMMLSSSCDDNSEYDILLETAKSDEMMLEDGTLLGVDVEQTQGSKAEKIVDSDVEKATSLKAEKNTEKTSEQEENLTESQVKIYVYVTGQVKEPGVYELAQGDRIFKAVELAGGFTKKAARKCVNLAEKLEDGQHINILSKSEYNIDITKNGKVVAEDSGEMDSQKVYKVDSNLQSHKDTNLININTASKEELMELSGIGTAKAAAILAYRNDNGEFENIEDIMKVPGIKEAAFQKLKGQIEV